MVLTGNPGNGKSTISRFITQVYRARFIASDGPDGTARQIVDGTHAALAASACASPRNRRWPIRVDLAELADDLGPSGDKSLLRWLSEKVTLRAEIDVKPGHPEAVAALLAVAAGPGRARRGHLPAGAAPRPRRDRVLRRGSGRRGRRPAGRLDHQAHRLHRADSAGPLHPVRPAVPRQRGGGQVRAGWSRHGGWPTTWTAATGCSRGSRSSWPIRRCPG